MEAPFFVPALLIVVIGLIVYLLIKYTDEVEEYAIPAMFETPGKLLKERRFVKLFFHMLIIAAIIIPLGALFVLPFQMMGFL